MKISEIISVLEAFAPLSLQESYDNSGLIYGNAEEDCTGALISLDCTEETVDETISRNCNLIISHHPPVFSGLKKFTGSNYAQRTIIKAIRNNVALYAIHTNLDNVKDGVNSEIATRLGLKNCRILQPMKGQVRRMITFCPSGHAEAVRKALFDAGAGKIGNYDECSFNSSGTGTFRALPGSDPFVGEIGKQNREEEVKIETVYYNYQERDVLKALKHSHPYEEVAYDILELSNENTEIGAGIIGDLEMDFREMDFLKKLKTDMEVEVIRHSRLTGKMVKKVAVCGGSGSFLLPASIRAGANVLVTGDFKYHQFFDAEDKIVIADIGHFESERFTVNLLERVISEKMRNFAVLISDNLKNPVKYLT